MKRYYFACKSIEELADIQRELIEKGLAEEQLSVLPRRDDVADQHEVRPVDSIQRSDIVRGVRFGAAVGAVAAVLVLLGAYFSGIAEASTWIPFIFAAIVLFGFSTWEGGLFGIEEPNRKFKRYEQELEQGNHLFIVDLEKNQEASFADTAMRRPLLRPVGQGDGKPGWVLSFQTKWRRFVSAMP